MGRNKIEIVKIQKKNTLNVTFSKRRGGLFKKAADFCRLSGEHIGILVFSPAGRPYTFGYPSADAVFDRFLNGTNTLKEVEQQFERTANNYNNVDDHQKRASCGCGSDDFWWDNINIEELDSIEKVREVKNAMLDLQQNVRKRINELTSSSSEPASSSCTALTAVTTPAITEPDLDNFGVSADELDLDNIGFAAEELNVDNIGSLVDELDLDNIGSLVDELDLDNIGFWADGLDSDNMGFSADEVSMILNEADVELNLQQNVRIGMDTFPSSTSSSAATTSYMDSLLPSQLYDDDE